MNLLKAVMPVAGDDDLIAVLAKLSFGLKAIRLPRHRRHTFVHDESMAFLQSTRVSKNHQKSSNFCRTKIDKMAAQEIETK